MSEGGISAAVAANLQICQAQERKRVDWTRAAVARSLAVSINVCCGSGNKVLANKRAAPQARRRRLAPSTQASSNRNQLGALKLIGPTRRVA